MCTNMLGSMSVKERIWATCGEGGSRAPFSGGGKRAPWFEGPGGGRCHHFRLGSRDIRRPLPLLETLHLANAGAMGLPEADFGTASSRAGLGLGAKNPKGPEARGRSLQSPRTKTDADARAPSTSSKPQSLDCFFRIELLETDWR